MLFSGYVSRLLGTTALDSYGLRIFMNVGLEHLLRQVWNAWILRGGRPHAEPHAGGQGWVLRLCGRARFTAWWIFLLFTGLLAATIILQRVAPMPPREFWLMVVGFALFALFATYYLIFAHRYRVVLTDQELTLERFLMRPRRIAWQAIVSFTFAPGGDVVRFQTDTGQKLGIYASLNGLSAVRRCLAAYGNLARTEQSWSTIDPLLMQHAPAWRCDDMDLEDDPFAPLGAWKSVRFEDKNAPQRIDGPIAFTQLDITERFGDNHRLGLDDWISTTALNSTVDDPESMGLPPSSASPDEVYRVAATMSGIRESIAGLNDGVYCPICHIATVDLGRLRKPCPRCGRELLRFGWD